MMRKSVYQYCTGFVLSLITTLVAYYLVTQDVLGDAALLFVLAELALIQLWVQLVFFLHLGRDKNGRWNIMAFLFMAMTVLIIVFGSIWIMDNLDYAHDHHGNKLETPKQVNDYIIHDEGH